MKKKKWARKARFIVVHLEGAKGADLHGSHRVEVRDAKKRLLRIRVVEYRAASPALSTIMADVEARLARNGLVVDQDSYQFAKDGRLLRAALTGRRHGELSR